MAINIFKWLGGSKGSVLAVACSSQRVLGQSPALAHWAEVVDLQAVTAFAPYQPVAHAGVFLPPVVEGPHNFAQVATLFGQVIGESGWMFAIEAGVDYALFLQILQALGEHTGGDARQRFL